MDRSVILEKYLQRTPTSARLARKAQAVFPSGITHDARYLRPYPIYVVRAQGSRKWDADGNEYVDYAGGHGALLLGHNDPTVQQAVRKQLELGTHYGACHELELRWGELVKRLVPCAELVRFTSSGTEATLLALRLARAYTGREKIMHFQGHFHGWHDHVAFGVHSHFDGSPTPGVVRGVAQQVVMAPPQDEQTTARLLEQHAEELAAVIIEPTGASWGQVPVVPEFLHFLREKTRQLGIVLIFDEVISGFRCAPGGAQQAWDVVPDLATLAKILAGGYPGGALVGRAEIMQALAFSEKQQREKISHHGTFNANPVSAAAGVACLEQVATGAPCQAASRYAEHLRREMNRVLREQGVPGVVYGTFSGFHVLLDPPEQGMTPEAVVQGRWTHETIKLKRRKELDTWLQLGMLAHGVHLFSWPGGPTSAVHTQADLDRTVEAFAATLRLMQEQGLFDAHV